MSAFLTQPLVLFVLGVVLLASAFVHVTRDGEGKAIMSILLGGTLCLVGILSWVGQEVGAFGQRCEAAGGHPRQFGTAMSSWECLTPDGRVIEVKGPGL